MSVVISFGPCSIISSGARAMACVSVSSMSITLRCAAYLKHRFAGTPISSSQQNGDVAQRGSPRDLAAGLRAIDLAELICRIDRVESEQKSGNPVDRRAPVGDAPVI